VFGRARACVPSRSAVCPLLDPEFGDYHLGDGSPDDRAYELAAHEYNSFAKLNRFEQVPSTAASSNERRSEHDARILRAIATLRELISGLERGLMPRAEYVPSDTD